MTCKLIDCEEALPCKSCNKLTTLGDEDYGDPYCSERCFAEHEAGEAEAAHERWLDSYYGGDGPTTVQEQYEAAAKVKAGLR